MFSDSLVSVDNDYQSHFRSSSVSSEKIIGWELWKEKKLGLTFFHGESAAIFSFEKNMDFEGLFPYKVADIGTT